MFWLVQMWTNLVEFVLIYQSPTCSVPDFNIQVFWARGDQFCKWLIAIFVIIKRNTEQTFWVSIFYRRTILVKQIIRQNDCVYSCCSTWPVQFANVHWRWNEPIRSRQKYKLAHFSFTYWFCLFSLLEEYFYFIFLSSQSVQKLHDQLIRNLLNSLFFFMF